MAGIKVLHDQDNRGKIFRERSQDMAQGIQAAGRSCKGNDIKRSFRESRRRGSLIFHNSAILSWYPLRRTTPVRFNNVAGTCRIITLVQAKPFRK